LWWAGTRIDWIGLGDGRNGLRAGLLGAVLAGVALMYFGLLALCGLRPAQFMRRG
jgi:putative peptidoglycan lipid II flippase